MPTILTDNSPMPGDGPYAGVAMTNVPADYLLHLKYEGNADERVMAYIDDNIDVLNQEVLQLTNFD
jgi:hypothetical protein